MKDLKVMLLNPPSPPGTTYVRVDRCMQKAEAWASSLWPPIALAHIQANLRTAGFETLLVDAVASQFSLEETNRVAKSYSPDLIIVNSSIPTVRWDMAVSDKIKNSIQNCFIAVIGVPPTIMPYECQRSDFIIKGEPELEVMDLVKDITSKSVRRIYGKKLWTCRIFRFQMLMDCL